MDETLDIGTHTYGLFRLQYIFICIHIYIYIHLLFGTCIMYTSTYIMYIYTYLFIYGRVKKITMYT